MSTTTLLVRQDQLATTRLQTTEDTALADGQVRVRVDQFALTANNITYAAMGDLLNYWQFFPTGEPGWGIVPVWGFGTVVQSLHPAIAVGERLYGYWPLASQAVLSPQRASPTGFSDGAAHRASLHAVYNHYVRVGADPFYQPDTEDVQALLRPLFITSWLIDDFLADQQFFGARRMVLSSASSKATTSGWSGLSRRMTGSSDMGLLETSKARWACRALAIQPGAEGLAQTRKDSPQPQRSFSRGLWNLKPSFRPSRTKSNSVPSM